MVHVQRHWNYLTKLLGAAFEHLLSGLLAQVDL